jgi:hypothetical protein
MTTGFQQTYQGLSIDKDTEAKLVYTLDWVNWLPQGDTLSSVNWTIAARANDPDPLVAVSSGLVGTKTYIELNQGQEGKTYTVSARVTTADGSIDRRYFRVKVTARSA